MFTSGQCRQIQNQVRTNGCFQRLLCKIGSFPPFFFSQWGAAEGRAEKAPVCLSVGVR